MACTLPKCNYYIPIFSIGLFPMTRRVYRFVANYKGLPFTSFPSVE